MFEIKTMNRRMAAAVRAEIGTGTLRGARWKPVPRGARVRLANGTLYFVHTICEDPGESGRVECLRKGGVHLAAERPRVRRQR